MIIHFYIRSYEQWYEMSTCLLHFFVSHRSYFNVIHLCFRLKADTEIRYSVQWIAGAITCFFRQWLLLLDGFYGCVEENTWTYWTCYIPFYCAKDIWEITSDLALYLYWPHQNWPMNNFMHHLLCLLCLLLLLLLLLLMLMLLLLLHFWPWIIWLCCASTAMDMQLLKYYSNSSA